MIFCLFPWGHLQLKKLIFWEFCLPEEGHWSKLFGQLFELDCSGFFWFPSFPRSKPHSFKDSRNSLRTGDSNWQAQFLLVERMLDAFPGFTSKTVYLWNVLKAAQTGRGCKELYSVLALEASIIWWINVSTILELPSSIVRLFVLCFCNLWQSDSVLGKRKIDLIQEMELSLYVLEFFRASVLLFPSDLFTMFSCRAVEIRSQACQPFKCSVEWVAFFFEKPDTLILAY